MKKVNELKKETIKKLKELKNNLSYDTEDNYCNLVNTLINYDNKAQDNLYLYDSCRECVEFLDEELLKYYIEYQIKEFGTCRVPYMFRSIEFEDSIYKCNAYGNLENVHDDDFIYCIDEAINKLKESLEV